MTDNSAETELLALADDLERDALHDGHSSDWFVAHCIRVRKAAKALRSTAATVSRDREGIAKVIDPTAFHEDFETKFRHCSPYKIEVVQETALRKADAILSLTPVGSGAEAMREALRHIKARAYSSDRMCVLPAESVAQIADIAANALAALPVPARQGEARYIERSKVREILIGQPDEDLHITEAILAEIDELPILSPVLVQLVQTRCEQPVLSGNDGSEAKSEIVGELAGALAQAVDRMKMVEDRKHPDSNGFIPQCSAAIAAAEKALAAAGFNRAAPASLTEGDVA